MSPTKPGYLFATAHCKSFRQAIANRRGCLYKLECDCRVGPHSKCREHDEILLIHVATFYALWMSERFTAEGRTARRSAFAGVFARGWCLRPESKTEKNQTVRWSVRNSCVAVLAFVKVSKRYAVALCRSAFDPKRTPLGSVL